MFMIICKGQSPKSFWPSSSHLERLTLCGVKVPYPVSVGHPFLCMHLTQRIDEVCTDIVHRADVAVLQIVRGPPGGGRVSGMHGPKHIFYYDPADIYFFSRCLVIKLFISLSHVFISTIS